MNEVLRTVQSIPAIWKGITLLVAGLLAGVLLVVQVTQLPARVARIEEEHKGLAYLICRAAREDEGKDPRDCRLLIRGMDAYLRELAR